MIPTHFPKKLQDRADWSFSQQGLAPHSLAVIGEGTRAEVARRWPSKTLGKLGVG